MNIKTIVLSEVSNETLVASHIIQAEGGQRFGNKISKADVIFWDKDVPLPGHYQNPSITLFLNTLKQRADEKNKGLTEYITDLLGISQKPFYTMLLADLNDSDKEALGGQLDNLQKDILKVAIIETKKAEALYKNTELKIKEMRSEWQDARKGFFSNLRVVPTTTGIQIGFIESYFKNTFLRAIAEKERGLDFLVHKFSANSSKGNKYEERAYANYNRRIYTISFPENVLLAENLLQNLEDAERTANKPGIWERSDDKKTIVTKRNINTILLTDQVLAIVQKTIKETLTGVLPNGNGNSNGNDNGKKEEVPVPAFTDDVAVV